MSEKKITILHSNDIHGQLNFTVNHDMEVVGGISLLSGYLKKTRAEGPTFYGICGDVLQEDVLGSDYKGTNTVELINYVNPDCISLGNHELDYGLAHLLIFKECVRPPVLCANMVVSNLHQPLFRPSLVREVGGVRMLLIGVIPAAFFNRITSDQFCRSMLEYKESYDAIREEIAAHEGERIDLVILMSHYGIEGDRILAEKMP
ncbi:MAG: metallophosphoesterase, partial [Lachnospiraceae bacterium]|nr:metallophosphoesterase [Lachnospiraceae bacterium]